MGEHKAGTLRIFMIYPYPASDLLDDKLADEKSQSRTLCTFVQFLEAVEYPVLFFQWDTATGIGDGKECDCIRFFPDFKGDSTFCRELGGVDEQIDKQLLQTGVVCDKRK